jgi:hypothetical protein
LSVNRFLVYLYSPLSTSTRFHKDLAEATDHDDKRGSTMSQDMRCVAVAVALSSTAREAAARS